MMRLSRSIVGEAEAEAVRRVLCDDGYLGMGNEVRLFEEELAAFLGVGPERIVSVNSGTAALHLAVQAVTTPGDEVLVPSLTFAASFQAVSAAGAVPVACDVLESCAALDLDDAARRITPATRAIMPVHYAGNPYRLDAVYAFAARHGLRVIEDAAHAFGCLYKGRPVGSAGDVVCFSFDGIKNITCGEGGCLVTSDPRTAALCRDARLLGIHNDTEKRFAGMRSWDFDITRQGWRYHMSNIMAAVGRVQLRRLPAEFGPARRERAALYRRLLAGVPGLALPEEDPDALIIPHIFPIRVLDGRRNELRAGLEAAGIPTGLHFKPNHLLSLYGGGRVTLPAAERLYAELLTLPLHPDLSLAEVKTVCDRVSTVLHGGRPCPPSA